MERARAGGLSSFFAPARAHDAFAASRVLFAPAIAPAAATHFFQLAASLRVEI